MSDEKLLDRIQVGYMEVAQFAELHQYLINWVVYKK